MRDRLEKIIAGYEELQNKLSDPAILNNHAEYTKLTKEYSNQGPLVAKAREYLQACDDIDDAKEMLDDPDMRELAQETIASAEAQLRKKSSHAHRATADEKDIIVEIRAAAGGDEAAIFAGDLYKMYLRFCDSQRWKTETMDVSPSDAGGYKGSVSGERATRFIRHEVRERRASRAARSDGKPGGRIHTSTATVARASLPNRRGRGRHQ